MFMFRQAPSPYFRAEDAVQRAITGGALIIDVREPDELARTGKAKGALHMPMGRLRAAADPRDPMYDHRFSYDTTMALYCGSGGRAQNARKMLHAMGYSDVHVIGSLDDWVAAGGTIAVT
ncbi:rhodanese-like domain-containing protein [Thalassovita mediterranea]|jgi:rhodanese-related sulfurtransferase|uniref:Molybdopterin biosynthesis protein MoeB n=1 Tax=Thalassovita mediterranea TaxID=340021 RepID=A0A0P1GS85_9RHOB|nr:rhodanese-like domain-containing protein [Thalassovita mediterranea]MCG7575171.1 sulfurtransferase [Phaeobacter sp. CNT1-3]CUH85401.1 molybdopterin biosynthesis protein MoeB [Thalassovita mediterranea]SIS35468.1 Rhodanese-related sulfurtransferase [Thalassovita mediterranea]